MSEKRSPTSASSRARERLRLRYVDTPIDIDAMKNTVANRPL